MEDILEEVRRFKDKNVTEVSEVVRTVELVIKRKKYRIEVRKRVLGELRDEDIFYEVKCWYYGSNSGDLDKLYSYTDFPWLNVNSERLALNRAISYLTTNDI